MAEYPDTTLKREKWSKWFKPMFYAAGYKSQHDFATAAHVSRVQVQRWLAGTARPNPENMPAIVEALRGIVPTRDIYAAASYDFQEPQREEHLDNFQAIFDALDTDDKLTLFNLAVRFQNRRTTLFIQPQNDYEVGTQQINTIKSHNHRILGIDLDNGFLRDPDGVIVDESQLPALSELMGQIAVVYVRGKYNTSRISGLLSRLREELHLQELVVEDYMNLPSKSTG